VGEAECLAVTEAETWMTPIIQYLEIGTCKLEEENNLRLHYDPSRPLLKRLLQAASKCITKEQAEYVIRKIHEGVCRSHSGGRTMTVKVLRVVYYWSTV